MNLKKLFNIKDKAYNFNFKYFEVHLVEHCNLNCQSCFHFSPLANEEFTDILEFEKDIKRLSELSNGLIESFLLMGGEPLLHPQCTEFFRISRNYFPNAKIQLVTNGILLPNQTNDFWLSMKKNNIVLRPTKYPINLNWEYIENLAQKYGIKIEYFNNIKISCKIPINPSGGIEPKKNFSLCGCNTCYILRKGYIYPCSTAPNIHHFNRFFNTNIKISPRNGINIYKVKSIYEIDNFLKKPIDMCKYCNGSQYHRYKRWEKTKYKIEEWT